MNNEDTPFNLTLAGLILMVLSFIIYIYYSSAVFIFTFAVGIILMVCSYIVLVRREETINRQWKELKQFQDSGLGGIISLDGPYTPYGDCGEIESLESHR